MSALYLVGLVVWGTALARIDFAEHRLPDRLTLPAYPAALLVTSMLWPAHIDVAVTSSIVFVFAGVLANQIADLGMGDVKLLGPIGMLAGGSDSVVPAIFLITAVGGVHALIHLVVGGTKHDHIPFGPAILSGAIPSLLYVT